MINCEMVRRHEGAIADMPFAADFIAFREYDSPCTHWLRRDTVTKINEAYVYRRGCGWRCLPFVPVRPEHSELVVIVNDRYIVHGVDIIKFFLECRLAREE